MAFRENNMLCGDIRTEMIENEICLLTLALNHIGHVRMGPISPHAQ